VGCGESQAGSHFDRFGPGAVVHLRRGEWRIIVVGALEELELRRVAESVATQ
jgi:hypothetical protein